MRIELLDETESTNEYIKRYLNSGENTIVCARRQTGGKGTKGRSFLSEEGGVYLSALTIYQNFPASDAFRIMSHAAVAVCRTARAFGADPHIKWANDVLTGQKKLCGILIENQICGDRLRASIVGIGLNVTNPLSGLEDIAARLSDVSERPVIAEQARDRLIEEYLKESSFGEYLSYVRFLGHRVVICESGRESIATARRILSDGRLEIEEEGRLRALSAAEISIKLS